MLAFKNIWIVIMGVLSIYASTLSAEPSLKDYGALPTIQMMAVSPDGNLVAYRKVDDGQDVVTVISLLEKKMVMALDMSAIKPRGIYFFNNEQLYLRVSDYTRIAGFRGKIDVSTAYVLNIKTKKIRQLLTPGDKIYAGQSGLGHVVGLSPDGEYALMPAYAQTSFSQDKPNFSLYRVGLTRKNLKAVDHGDAYVSDFFVNASGDVIAKEKFDEKKKLHTLMAKKDDRWVEIFKEETDIRNRSFVGTTPDYKSLVMLTVNEKTGRTAYYTISLADGVISDPILTRDDADIEEAIVDIQRVVHGVRYSGFMPSYNFFDPKLDQRVNKIIENFPGQSVWLSSWSPDWKHVIVNVEGASYPDDYFLFSGEQEAQFLATGRPNIKPEELSPIGQITFAARDGLKIPTLITIPRDKVSSMKNLPAVIYPHGGPAAYDMVGFEFIAQALASQGYLVIQPQFRGSDGFGSDHYSAGHGEWGKKMQDDLTDAVKFFSGKGFIDPNRVCIVGASYGGYAALAGGAFTPELYKCVVSINGIGDLNDMLAWDKYQNGDDSEVVAYMAMQFANGDVDKKELVAMSPEKHAKNYTAPVLLIHSENDKRVPIKQSKQMLNALKRAKKSAELVTLDGDNHHLSEGPTRQKALEETVKFVNRHLALQE